MRFAERMKNLAFAPVTKDNLDTITAMDLRELAEYEMSGGYGECWFCRCQLVGDNGYLQGEDVQVLIIDVGDDYPHAGVAWGADADWGYLMRNNLVEFEDFGEPKFDIDAWEWVD